MRKNLLFIVLVLFWLVIFCPKEQLGNIVQKNDVLQQFIVKIQQDYGYDFFK